MIISNENSIILNYQYDTTDNINQYETKYEYYKILKNDILFKTFDNTSDLTSFISYQISEEYIYKDEEVLNGNISIKNKPINFSYNFNIQINDLLKLDILFYLNKYKKILKNNYLYINLNNYYNSKFLYSTNYIKEEKKFTNIINIDMISYKNKNFPNEVIIYNGDDVANYTTIWHSDINTIVAEFYINENDDSTSINLNEKFLTEYINTISHIKYFKGYELLSPNILVQYSLNSKITNNSTDIDTFFLDLTNINENYILVKSNYKLRYTSLLEENKTYQYTNPISLESNYTDAIFNEPSNEYRILESKIIYNIILNDATSQVYEILDYYNFNKILGNAEIKILPNIKNDKNSGIKEADYNLLIYKFNNLPQFTKKDININNNENLIYQL